MSGESRDEKKRPGRKPRPLPPKIDASPEAVAHMLVTSPPKKEWEWEYPEKYGNADEDPNR